MMKKHVNSQFIINLTSRDIIKYNAKYIFSDHMWDLYLFFYINQNPYKTSTVLSVTEVAYGEGSSWQLSLHMLQDDRSKTQY